MSRIELQNPQNTTGESKEILAQINSAFGVTPNMFKAVANSTPALKMMWGAFGALSSGKLGAQLGEQIAVTVAQLNRCEYCLAAHTALGIGAGLSGPVMAQAQVGKSSDPKTQVALDFVKKLVTNRGHISSDDISFIKKNGYSDEEVTEILAHVALNIFTNYTNIAFEIPVDFPKVALQ